MSFTRPHQSGLTLLELLVALAIFSMLAVSSYNVLSSVMSGDRRAQQLSGELAEYRNAMRLIQSDLDQWVDRSIRVGERRQAALLVEDSLYPLTFTRTGHVNPLELPVSDLQRVAYGIRAVELEGRTTNVLVRFHWKQLDRNERAEPQQRRLIVGVTNFSVEVISAQGRHGNWPLDSQQVDPVALLLRFEHPVFGELEKLVALR